MKKALIYMALLLGGWSFSSCKKETSVENGNNLSANFTAQINGAKWAASPTLEGATILQGMINITGISTDSQEISITITDTAVGTYSLSPQTTSLAAYGNVDSSNQAIFSTSQGTDSTQAGGSVTVTQIDQTNKTISGTFAFKVYRTSDGQQKTITSGVFNKIPYTTTLPSGSPTDTLTATIDGAAWTSQSVQATSMDGQLTIVGFSANLTQSVGLIMPTSATFGTHALTPTGAIIPYMAVYDFVASNGSNTAAPATSGTINILENNTSTSRLRGNFSFTTSDPNVGNSNHSITTGFFSVYYGQ